MSNLRRAFPVVLALLGGSAGVAALRQDPFDHEEHAKLFPGCENCHAGITDPARSVWPTAESCASCHDGTVEKQVTWTAPAGPAPSNLRFTHAKHAEEVLAKAPADSALQCDACHLEKNGQWMAVSRTRSAQCLDCHKLPAEHLAGADTSCATCHLSLAEATTLPRERVAKFGTPANHDAANFMTSRGHGELAKPPAGTDWAVAPSCTTCHARDFCAQCHVNAPEVKLIQAMAPDPRSLAITAELKEPASHEDGRFLARHGGQARKDAASCATCHTQQSCVACHRTQPAIAMALPEPGPGRGTGAVIERQQPASHTVGFADWHGQEANAAPKTCAACHARAECLDCHRPNPGASGSYHAAGFLTRHPSAAFSRESDCADCHNQSTFCATCHEKAGLANSGRALAGGYHDSRGSFLLSHGTAARQNLESCVTCHTERDCLACHSAQTRRFNPHGPGFNPERLRRRNPQTCAACHGNAIPDDD